MPSRADVRKALEDAKRAAREVGIGLVPLVAALVQPAEGRTPGIHRARRSLTVVLSGDEAGDRALLEQFDREFPHCILVGGDAEADPNAL
jgi:hypothetical protein